MDSSSRMGWYETTYRYLAVEVEGFQRLNRICDFKLSRKQRQAMVNLYEKIDSEWERVNSESRENELAFLKYEIEVMMDKANPRIHSDFTSDDDAKSMSFQKWKILSVENPQLMGWLGTVGVRRSNTVHYRR